MHTTPPVSGKGFNIQESVGYVGCREVGPSECDGIYCRIGRIISDGKTWVMLEKRCLNVCGMKGSGVSTEKDT